MRPVWRPVRSRFRSRSGATRLVFSDIFLMLFHAAVFFAQQHAFAPPTQRCNFFLTSENRKPLFLAMKGLREQDLAESLAVRS
jgi:hypothetical protein